MILAAADCKLVFDNFDDVAFSLLKTPTRKKKKLAYKYMKLGHLSAKVKAYVTTPNNEKAIVGAFSEYCENYVSHTLMSKL